jgi:magnesium chelatase subunit D
MTNAMMTVTRRPVFPFTALVGQERMKRALLLNAVNPRLGGVLIRGEKGTAKSTAARALAALLPRVAAVAGCPYSCDPDQEEALCDACAARLAAGEVLERVERDARVVDLPVGATEDRVVGTLDLERAIGQGERHFEPGLLAAANRGILYVDEVNLLGDHLVDVLLDAAAMGRNVVEREGVSASHPAEFVLIGTMNPEEGDIRPQLLDRFALAVEVGGMPDPAERAEVVRRRIAYEADSIAFMAQWAAAEQAERERVRRARALLPGVCVHDGILRLITTICAEAKVDGLRGDLVMYRAAATLAAYAGRTAVMVDDVREAAELALPHRRRRQPFEQPGLDRDQLEETIRRHQQSEGASGDGSRGLSPRDGRAAPRDASARGDGADGHEPDGGPGPAQAALSRVARSEAPQVYLPEEGRTAPSLTLRRPDSRVRAGAGRRSVTRTSGGGQYVGAALPRGDASDLALDATLRAAAPYQRARRAGRVEGPVVCFRRSDLRVKVREARTGALIIFVVDASGSMGAQRRMAAAKGAVLALLHDAYRRRDRVGLVTFRGMRATAVLAPTGSVELAEHHLRELPTGGRTPLAHGLVTAAAMVRHHLASAPAAIPLLVILSDGRANVALCPDSRETSGSAEALSDARAAASEIARLGWTGIVVDTEAGRTRLGLAHDLSMALGACYMRLDEMMAGGLASAVLSRAVRSVPLQGRRRGR